MVHPRCTWCGWAMHLADLFDLADVLPPPARLAATRAAALSAVGCVWVCVECPSWRPVLERAILDLPRRGRVIA